MGNTCAGPNGFFQSVTAAVWRTRALEDRLLPPEDQTSDESKKLEESSKKGSNHTPHEIVKITDEDQKPKKTKYISAGLQMDSVLGRKTASLKEIYTLGKKLGQGHFGTTFLCIEKATGKHFACKSIAKRKLTTREDVDDVRREIQIMQHLKGHPNVIKIVDVYEDAVAVHVVMELCGGGELFDRIVQRGHHYTERKAAKLARVIVRVLHACHSSGVMHRDLKPESFLFVDQGEEAPLKIIDFGISVFFRPGETFSDVVGSSYYVAPEVLKKHYGPECDVWGAGVITYILLSGVPPFCDETEQGKLDFVSQPWADISESAKDLIRKMLVRDPKKRLTAHEALRHPWIQGDGLASDRPLDSAIVSRLKRFSAMNMLKRIAGIRVIAERLSEEEITGLKEIFKMIDSDGSGEIAVEELKRGLVKVGANNLKDCEIYDMMQAADIDSSGTIVHGELIAAMLHLNKIGTIDYLFEAFDKDGSGYMTQDELQQHVKSVRTMMDELIQKICRYDARYGSSERRYK